MKVRGSWLAGAAGIVATAGVLALGVGHVQAGSSHERSSRVSACAGAEPALAVIGLTSDGELVCFNELRTSRTATIGAISGLAVDTRLVGIDFRPATGDLV